MSQEGSDWYSGDTSLFHSGSLWWPLCRQWQHLRQHHTHGSVHSHTRANTQFYIHVCSGTRRRSFHTQTHTYTLSRYTCSKSVSSSLFLSSLYSHTQLSPSLPKACGLWPRAIHSLLKATMCMWLLKAKVLMPFCLHPAVCMHGCVFLCACEWVRKKFTMYVYVLWVIMYIAKHIALSEDQSTTSNLKSLLSSLIFKSFADSTLYTVMVHIISCTSHVMHPHCITFMSCTIGFLSHHVICTMCHTP